MRYITSNSKSWEKKFPDANLKYYKSFLSSKESKYYYQTFLKKIPWQHEDIKLFGKSYAQPRLTSLHSLYPLSYSYSGLSLKSNIMNQDLLDLLDKIKLVFNYKFNTVLINLYRNGYDSNGWHADNEKELGENPQIASISFGENRFFHFKHRFIKNERYKMELHNGSLLLMKGAMQRLWLHQIPKTKKQIGPRINLTFRKII